MPIRFGHEPFIYDRYVVLDLEYFVTTIYCVGVHIEDGRHSQTLVMWSDGPREARAVFGTLRDIVNDYEDAPILTWGGNAADLPAMRSGANRYRIKTLLKEVERRHIDVFQYMRRNIRLPIPTLELKNVAEFFGHRTTSRILGGMDANYHYWRYQNAESPQEARSLRRELERYNKNDLHALRCAIRGIQRIIGTGR